MVAQQTLNGVFDTARRLVDFLEQDGFDIETAVWALDDEGRGRLYLVPRDRSADELKQMISVAETISRHRDEGAYSNGTYVDEAYVLRPAA